MHVVAEARKYLQAEAEADKEEEVFLLIIEDSPSRDGQNFTEFQSCPVADWLGPHTQQKQHLMTFVGLQTNSLGHVKSTFRYM